MKVLCICLFPAIILLTVNTAKFFGNINSKYSNSSSLEACLKLQSQLPYLSLNCDELLEKENKTISSNNFILSNIFGKQENEKKESEEEIIITISIKDLKNNTKKVSLFILFII